MPQQAIAIAQLLDDVAGMTVHSLVGDALLLAIGNPAGVEAGVSVVDGEGGGQLQSVADVNSWSGESHV